MAESSVQSLGRLLEQHEFLKRAIAVADKNGIEHAARVVAAHIGCYQRRFGTIPIEETLAAVSVDYPNEEQIADLVAGMDTLIAILMLATGVADGAAGRA